MLFRPIESMCFNRWKSNWSILATPKFVQFQYFNLQKTWDLRVTSKKSAAESGGEVITNDGGVSSEEAPKTTKRAPRRTRKKKTLDIAEESPIIATVSHVPEVENMLPKTSNEDSKKTRRKTRKKDLPTSSDGEIVEKTTTRRRKMKKKIDDIKDEGSDAELSDQEVPSSIETILNEKEEDFEFAQGGEDDVSFTYSWPPLVCCFGATQHAFIPSGRPANRLIDYEIHEKNEALWSPSKFVRAPGGSSSSVSVALASLGGRVAFMGKVGDDDYGQTMLYYLNMNNVQTRSVTIDSKRLTAVSHMKMIRRGGLRMTSVEPCAEDTFSRSDINIDVLKEAKMFYFNSSALLDQNMRSTTLQAIKISKKLGGVIFFDLNLPLPLWESHEETKRLIEQAWNIADIVEVTKQELEFLCGIEPSEDFDTKDNSKSKFIHHKWEVIKPIWHDNLKVLFMTNGTSKIHYYTEEYNGSVLGMEDAPITPFTCDMSASGDGIVAGMKFKFIILSGLCIMDSLYK
ncbi:hypothetical protein GIB67_001827 [Kingdonia uniflora]|uniref:Carbohydrate kinase PfkB domain-containing protein n=1 Tax=Kingdonia uniflora TaxID=39325 RepID=A0A7J7LBN8_9MAGN|nr:hypothetical protein GIB67_001827 [Kingdonia uniflora]